MINSKGKPEAHELSINELDAVSGGRTMLDMAVDAAEKYMNGLFGRLIEAVHKKA
jgi:bacteriocin-like protein